jgi:hypothetical protein
MIGTIWMLPTCSCSTPSPWTPRVVFGEPYKRINSRSQRSKTVLHDDHWTEFYRHPVSEVTLVRRINRALADSGLQVRTARRGSLTAGLAGRYYFVYGTRAFRLRVGIDELARALGILHEVESAAPGLPRHAATHACAGE